MKRFFVLLIQSSLIVLFSAALISSCQQTPKLESPKENLEDLKKTSWKNQMRVLEASLTQLLPLAMDPKKYTATSNEKAIQGHLTQLQTLSQQVNHSSSTQNLDPSLRFISSDFKEQIDITASSFQEGKKEFSRYNVLHLSYYCIECHTRNSQGPSFGAEKLTEGLGSLSLLDQAEYLTAVRKFDQALQLYEKYFQQNELDFQNLFKAERAAQSALSISVRYQKSPTNTAHFLKAMESSKKLPMYLQRSMVYWKKDVESWKKEKKGKVTLASVKKRLDLANKRRADAGGLAGEVLILRSLEELHDLLMKTAKDDQKVETLYLLGMAYSQTESRLFLNLQEKYFESCIRGFPESPWASKCFEKLEENLVLDYSGSAGTFIPPEVRTKLDELRGLINKGPKDSVKSL